MKKASEYRQHAAECRLLAARASNPEHKAMLETMAETWNGLARDREEYLIRKERAASLESDDTAM